MLEHGYGIRISESFVDPNPWMVERQDPDNFICFQTRKRCAWEIAAYVFKWTDRPAMTIAVDMGRKATKTNKKIDKIK